MSIAVAMKQYETLFAMVHRRAREEGLEVKLCGVNPDRFEVGELSNLSLFKIAERMGWLTESHKWPSADERLKEIMSWVKIP